MLPARTWDAIKLRARGLGLVRNPDVFSHAARHESVIGHLSESERSYIAGILDGEGCIIFQRVRRAKHDDALVPYKVSVSICNTSRRMIEWINERIPARVYIDRTGNPQWRKRYNWMLCGMLRSRIFCHEIAPYLIIKREQAELMAAGWLHLSNDERAELHQKMRDLKRQDD